MSATRDLLDRLVGFPTVSCDSNVALIDYVADYLDQFGVASTRVPSDDGTKVALYANVGPDVAGGVVLSGHSDVVPVTGQDWASDPFQLVERAGRLHGRGTCDMKGFIALSLAAVPMALDRGIKRPLQIAISYDEEVGMNGAPPMIDHMVAEGMARAATVIVGEPSMMQVVTGHKGCLGYRIHVRGHEVHSSMMHTGVSAVMVAADFISWANGINAASAAATPAPLAAEFAPPYTTLHAGMIQGGTAMNITARDCVFSMDFRVVPGDDPADWDARVQAKAAELTAQMNAIHPNTGVTAEQNFNLTGLTPEQNGPAEALARQLTGDNGAHVVSYGTEGGLFQDRGYSTVICGPGDIAQAHQPNEFITLDQLAQGEVFMQRLVDHLAS